MSDNSENTEIEYLKSKIAVLEQLIEVCRKTAPEQTEKANRNVFRHRDAEETTKDNGLFLQILIDSIPTPIFYKNKEGKYIGCNKAFESFLGLQKREIVGKTVYDIAPKELADHYHEADKALLRSIGKQIYESRIKHSNGSVRDVIFHKAVFFNGKGELAGLIGVILDITDYKRLEETLRHRMDFEKTVASVSRRFLTLSNFDTAVNTSLADAGRLCRAGRAYLFQFRDNGETMDNTHEWCDTGVTSEMHRLQRLPSKAFPWLIEKLKTDNMIHIEDVSQMPDEASAERAELERQSIKSILIIPIYVKKILAGFVGFDNVMTTGLWSEEDVAMLHIMAEIIGTAMERRYTEDIIKNMAYHDTLTQLPNRNLFQDHLQIAMSRAKHNKTQVAVIILDIDDFKTINDSLGHHTGDSLLKVVAKRLVNCVREGDTVARMGGDEFMIILHGLAQPQSALFVAQKILSALVQPFLIDGQEICTTASVGISIFPDNANDSENLIKQADIAMYKAKRKGKNTYTFYKPDMVIHA